MMRWIEIYADSITKTTKLNAQEKSDITLLLGNSLGGTVSSELNAQVYSMIINWLIRCNPPWQRSGVSCRGECKNTPANENNSSSGHAVMIGSWDFLVNYAPHNTTVKQLLSIELAKRNINQNIIDFSDKSLDDLLTPTDTATTGTGTNTGIQTPAADSSMLKNVLIVAAAIGVLFFLYRFLKPKTVVA